MKKLIFLCIAASFCIAIHSCKKNDTIKDDSINPETQPSELCASFIVSGVNKNGRLPDSTSSQTPKIPKNLISASVTNDNRIFLSFTLQSANAAKGLYLSVEGADNYWDINLNGSNSLTMVLPLGISSRVLNGVFKLSYRLYDASGNAGNKAITKVTIVDPVAYCNTNGNISTRNGNDGLDAMRYTLGNKKGWVTITYDMYTVKDRMDIQYNGKFIRSTGNLLQANQYPPVGKCSEVGIGADGFVSGTGKFQFFYDPEISTRIDVIVSGCLDGGTAWDYKIVECPKDVATLGIHSNWTNGSLIDGHGWVSLTEDGQTTLWGLWPDNHHTVAANNLSTDPNVTDIRKGLEKGIGSSARYYQLNSTQLQTIKNILLENKKWSLTYNCSSFVEELVNRSGVDNINFNDIIIGSPVETPRRMTAIITDKERVDPTNTYRPPGQSIDAGSCSFCW